MDSNTPALNDTPDNAAMLAESTESSESASALPANQTPRNRHRNWLSLERRGAISGPTPPSGMIIDSFGAGAGLTLSAIDEDYLILEQPNVPHRERRGTSVLLEISGLEAGTTSLFPNAIERPDTPTPTHFGYTSPRLRPIPEAERMDLSISPQAERPNTPVNILGLPLHENLRPAQNDSSPFPRRAQSPSSESPPSLGRGPPFGRPTRDQSQRSSNRSPIEDYESSRNTSRSHRRRHQSADHLTPPHHDLLNPNFEEDRRRNRRTENLAAQQVRRDPYRLAPELAAPRPSYHSPETSAAPFNNSGLRSLNNHGSLAEHTEDSTPEDTRTHVLAGNAAQRRLEIDFSEREVMRSRGIGSARNRQIARAPLHAEVMSFRSPTNRPLADGLLDEPHGLDISDGRPEAKEAADLMVNLECRVCMTQLVDTALLPCGHAVLCRWCADQHMQLGTSMIPRCPMCRVHLKQKLQIYF
ncbi:hypothetical protein FQN54_001680 [Arachnomyces sp. PD_36]|nr:hypothetical protein FQN54_001680 [Arachnomyces sp. PD_36]